MENIADKLVVEIKEEPIDEEVHSEHIFIREEHYDFNGVYRDHPTTSNESKKKEKAKEHSDSQISESGKDNKQIPNERMDVSHIKKEINSSEDEQPDYFEEEFRKIDSDKSKPKHQCKICNKVFPRKAHMIRHEKIHLSGKERGKRISGTDTTIIKFGDIEVDRATFKTFDCHLCDKNFTRNDILKRHIRVKHPDSQEANYETRFTCDVCKKYFKTSIFLEMHMKAHQGINPHVCAFCNKDLKDLSHLKEHLRIHTGEKPYKCDLCDKAFIRNVTLKKHKEDVHKFIGLLPNRQKSTNRVQEILCNFCGKSFTRPDSLRMHMVAHNGEKSFVCELCGRAFAYKKSLVEHYRLHTGERPFGCEYCPKRFVRSYDLKQHVQITHPIPNLDLSTPNMEPQLNTDEEKKFVCEICFSRFKTNAILKIHQRGHTGERPYECESCPKTFVTPGDLRVHNRIHTGEKPFTCNLCESNFRVKSALTKHQKTCCPVVEQAEPTLIKIEF